MGRGIMIGQLAQPPPIRVGCGRVLVSNNNMERKGGNSSVGCRLLCVCHGLLRSRQITNPRNFMCKPASLHPPHHSRQAQLLVPGHQGSHPLAWIRYSRSHEGTECSASPEHQQSEICFIPWEADLGRCCLLASLRRLYLTQKKPEWFCSHTTHVVVWVQHWVYGYPRAAVLKHHKPEGFRRRNSFSHSYENQKTKIERGMDWTIHGSSPKALGTMPPMPFPS